MSDFSAIVEKDKIGSYNYNVMDLLQEPWWMHEALAGSHSPALSNYRCDLHILLNAVSILLFGIISPLPLLKLKKPEIPLRMQERRSEKCCSEKL